MSLQPTGYRAKVDPQVIGPLGAQHLSYELRDATFSLRGYHDY